MKLIIHDGTAAFEEELRRVLGGGEELCFVSERQPIRHCTGCFGCWVKTPTRCVITDGYHTTPEKCARADEVIVISRCVCGMYSPFVKNVLDRNIGYIHPYFAQRNGEMHHKLRYDRQLPMRFFFYGECTGEGQSLARRIVQANRLNMNFAAPEIVFAGSLEEIPQLLSDGKDRKTYTGQEVRRKQPAQEMRGEQAVQAECREQLTQEAREGQITQAERGEQPSQVVQAEQNGCAMVCASPKARASASAALLRMLCGHLTKTQVTELFWSNDKLTEDEIERLGGCKTLVLAFPLYVDCLPSHLLRCLEQLRQLASDGRVRLPQRVYAIVNNGFYEATQNIPAIEVIRLWCRRMGITFAGGLAVGCGGMVASVYRAAGANGPLKRIDEQLGRLAENIEEIHNGQAGYRQGKIVTVQPGFPRILYKMMAEAGWRDAARKNGLKVRELGKR